MLKSLRFIIAVTAFISLSAGKLSAQFTSYMIKQDGRLLSGKRLLSVNGRYSLLLQTDGNLVIYNRGTDDCTRQECSIWSSNTAGSRITHLYMQNDGNLVLMDRYTSRWSSNSGNGKYPPYNVRMQDDGNLVVYNIRKQAVWSSRSGLTNIENRQPTADEAYKMSNLQQNEQLLPNERLVSPNGIYTFIVQPDGNLVLYRKAAGDNCTSTGCSIWSSNTPGRRVTNLLMQGDGNLVLQNSGRTVWNSQSSSNRFPPYRLQMQDDGNLVVYNVRGQSVWSSAGGARNNEQ